MIGGQKAVVSGQWSVMSERPVRSYRDLLVWQKGIGLVKEVYLLTEKFPHSEKFALTSQIRRSVISIPSNIAEGQARQHTPEFRHFLHIALGSLAELDTQLTIALELGYAEQKDLNELNQRIVELRKMISGLLSKLTPRGQKERGR